MPNPSAGIAPDPLLSGYLRIAKVVGFYHCFTPPIFPSGVSPRTSAANATMTTRIHQLALLIIWEMGAISAALVLCNGPEAEVSEELCEGGGLVVGVEAAGVGEDPGVAAAEGVLLEADAGVFDAGDDAVGADADEGDDGGAPAFDFGFEALAAGAKFVVGEFIGAGGGAFDDVGDAEFEVEKEDSSKGEKRRGVKPPP